VVGWKAGRDFSDVEVVEIPLVGTGVGNVMVSPREHCGGSSNVGAGCLSMAVYDVPVGYRSLFATFTPYQEVHLKACCRSHEVQVKVM
jgi:hypothetical protein